MKALTVITSPRGDWTVVQIGCYTPVTIYQGHDRWTEMIADICENLEVDVQFKTISNEDMERLYG
jgi:hypothetical protein